MQWGIDDWWILICQEWQGYDWWLCCGDEQQSGEINFGEVQIVYF
jgi:hypothetical protein